MTLVRIAALFGLLALCGTIRAESEAGIDVTETEEGFLFREGDDDVLFYQRTPKSLDGRYERANYVHPLYDLDGHVLTEDFPADHLHHRGIFWAWHQVWVGEQKIGDAWTCRDFIWDVADADVVDRPAGAKALRVRVLWKSPEWRDESGKLRPIVEETTEITVHPRGADTRAIDFQIGLRAIERNVRIGGSEDDKAYGGFSTRIRLPEDILFTSRKGVVTPERTSIDAGPWMDMSARFGDGDDASGLTILCHPDSAGFPQPWILRDSHSMQNPAFPGRSPMSLSRSDPMTLRYRLILHHGPADPALINEWQREFTQ